MNKLVCLTALPGHDRHATLRCLCLLSQSKQVLVKMSDAAFSQWHSSERLFVAKENDRPAVNTRWEPPTAQDIISHSSDPGVRLRVDNVIVDEARVDLTRCGGIFLVLFWQAPMHNLWSLLACHWCITCTGRLPDLANKCCRRQLWRMCTFTLSGRLWASVPPPYRTLSSTHGFSFHCIFL